MLSSMTKREYLMIAKCCPEFMKILSDFETMWEGQLEQIGQASTELTYHLLTQDRFTGYPNQLHSKSTSSRGIKYLGYLSWKSMTAQTQIELPIAIALDGSMRFLCGLQETKHIYDTRFVSYCTDR